MIKNLLCIIRNGSEKKLSNKLNGEIYFNYKVEPKLTTTISNDKKLFSLMAILKTLSGFIVK